MAFSYALTALWALWGPAALFGGLLFSPLIALAGGVAFATSHRDLRPQRAYAWLLTGLLVWTGVSAFWSASDAVFVSGDLLEGDFSVDAAIVRITAIILAGALTLGATQRLEKAAGPRRSMIAAAAFHALGVLTIALFLDAALRLFAPISDPVLEQPQNFIRNAAMFSLIAPTLAVALWLRATSPAARFGVAAGIVLALIACGLTNAQGAQLAIVASLAAGALVLWRREDGFRRLADLIAAYILAAPLIMFALISWLRPYAADLPLSFQSRLWSWRYVIEKVAERPFFGHGLESAGGWTSVYADRPDWPDTPGALSTFPIVPGHPHNMLLELWAETGLVGAGLAAGAVWTFGRRLPPPSQWAPGAAAAAAGLAGAVAAHAGVAYSIWNDAFWAAAVIAATGVVLLNRNDPA